MRIVFTGAQGTGKSTLIDAIKDNLPEDYQLSVNITRDLLNEGYTINQGGNDISQTMIMSKHIENLQYENLISDRCIIDVFCYTWYLYLNGRCDEELFMRQLSVVLHNVEMYDIIFYIEPEFDVIDDGVRSDDVNYRDSMALLFKAVINHLNEYYDVNIIQLSGTVQERLSVIDKYME